VSETWDRHFSNIVWYGNLSVGVSSSTRMQQSQLHEKLRSNSSCKNHFPDC